jgi:alanine dehydrogenase
MMRIGVPKEIKNNEFRVALTPSGVSLLRKSGHPVYLEQGAGEGSGFSDEEYNLAGAEVLSKASEVWGKSEMIKHLSRPCHVCHCS